MRAADDDLLYMALGPLGAIVLGIALIPLREVTTASNLGFAFVILTIVIAEVGGGAAALWTAAVSALSLDFFLTHPYLRLTMAGKGDIMAFLGLSACGLVAAELASRRTERVRVLREASRQLEMLHAGLIELERWRPGDAALQQLLESCRNGLPVSALVVRDGKGAVVATSQRARVIPQPLETVEEDSLLRREGTGAGYIGHPGPPLPREGARLALTAGNRQVGWLDLWGSGAPADFESRRTLSDMARMMALLLAREGPP